MKVFITTVSKTEESTPLKMWNFLIVPASRKKTFSQAWEKSEFIQHKDISFYNLSTQYQRKDQ